METTINQSPKAQKLVERMGQKLNRQMAGSLLACVHCGMCTDSCHYVLANPGDVTYAPAFKADRIRKIFKRHFDWTGRVFPKFAGAATVNTDEDLEELKDKQVGFVRKSLLLSEAKAERRVLDRQLDLAPLLCPHREQRGRGRPPCPRRR